MSDQRWNIHKTLITIAGMAFLFGLACIAAFVFGIDGKLLIGCAIIIACLANSDILKLVVSYLPKYIEKTKNGKR